VEPGDVVDGVGEEGRHNEAVGCASDDVCNLDVELLPVAVQETSGDAIVYTVKTDDVVGPEESIEDKTDNSSDAVLSEHIHRIINTDPGNG